MSDEPLSEIQRTDCNVTFKVHTINKPKLIRNNNVNRNALKCFISTDLTLKYISGNIS